MTPPFVILLPSNEALREFLMQQRQLRLGDILDDYCPRERRLTNHAVVAMIGVEVKQTRCTTCEAEHEYKHAKVPRQRKKGEESAALYSQVLAAGPKRVTHEAVAPAPGDVAPRAVPPRDVPGQAAASGGEIAAASAEAPASVAGPDAIVLDGGDRNEAEEGPVHRPLIRATLPRQEGQAPPARPAPDFTIRQPGGRHNRFRARNQRGGPMFQGNRPPGSMGGASGRQTGGRPSQGPQGSRGSPSSRLARRHNTGHKRSK